MSSKATSKRDPPTLAEGEVIRPQVADGYAYYEIIELNPQISRVKHRPDLAVDAYKWGAVGSDGRILTTILERQVNREQKMAELFG